MTGRSRLLPVAEPLPHDVFSRNFKLPNLLLVGGFGEKQFPPVHGQAGEGGVFQAQLLGDFSAQKPAEPGAGFGQLAGVVGRDGFPPEKIGEQVEQARRRFQPVARRFDVARQPEHRADRFAAVPEAERVAVGVEQVRQGLEFFPLRLVVAPEAARVGSLAGGFHLDTPPGDCAR